MGCHTLGLDLAISLGENIIKLWRNSARDWPNILGVTLDMTPLNSKLGYNL